MQYQRRKKMLDRFVFIRFCEDNYFINKPFDGLDSAIFIGFPFWDSLKQLFTVVDKGNPPHIHKFNGGSVCKR